MTLHSFISNLKKRGLKDVLNPLKWKVILWEWFSEGKVVLEEDDIQSYAEQWVYRSIKCRPCLLSGECSHCGCLMPDALNNKFNACSAGEWGPMLDKDSWEEQKEIIELTFEINIK
jgi:hypothetical protein